MNKELINYRYPWVRKEGMDLEIISVKTESQWAYLYYTILAIQLIMILLLNMRGYYMLILGQWLPISLKSKHYYGTDMAHEVNTYKQLILHQGFCQQGVSASFGQPNPQNSNIGTSTFLWEFFYDISEFHSMFFKISSKWKDILLVVWKDTICALG